MEAMSFRLARNVDCSAYVYVFIYVHSDVMRVNKS